MKKTFYLIMMLVNAMIIGMYLAYCKPIESYKWIITIGFFVYWIVSYRAETKK